MEQRICLRVRITEKRMYFESERDLTMRYACRFGEIAMRKGFVNAKQVKEALAEQTIYQSFTGLRHHKLIGEILFENGWITLNQIVHVLKEISDRQQF
jgi:hypothetical protein